MSGVGIHAQFGPFFHNGDLQGQARMYLYEPGTSTLRAAYTDRGLLITALNPLRSDANGLFAAYFSGLYDIVVKADDDATVLADWDAVNFADPTITSDAAGEVLRLGPSGALGDAEDATARWMRIIGWWASGPATPGSRSNGDRIIIFENASAKTGIGMHGQNGLWVQSHGANGEAAFAVWAEQVSTTPVKRWEVTFDGRVKVPNTSRVHIPVIATASLPAAAAAEDGSIVIEDAGTGNRNLILYAGGQRFRIDGGSAV